MGSLQGKIALVTGAARGIGRAIVKRMLSDGVTGVALIDSNGAMVNETAAELGPDKCLAIACDVSKPEQVQAAVAQALTRFGVIDILVNNAGITRDKILHKMDLEAWQAVLDVNLSGPYYFCRELMPHMRERGYGRIVNISSTSAFGNPGQANYAASKAGLIGLTKTVAKEGAAKNVTANCVAPGAIDTEMFDAVPEDAKKAFVANIPMKRMGKPEEVAAAVSFLSSDDAGFITGECLVVSGGMLK